MKTMEELATIYNLDKQKAVLAGLLHDSAKELNSAQWAKLIRDSNIATDDENIYDYDHYLHGPVGAFLVQRDLGINDDDILAAIATHGYYGSWEQFNRPIGWCLRMADILEPGRDWSENRWVNVVFEPLRTATYSGHLGESIQIWLKRLVEWYENEDVPVHPNIH
jgi:predicted HD superfamily hydrolase involved in NAD metabolism